MKLFLGRKIVENPVFLASSTRLTMPLTGFKSPFSDNSPTNAVYLRSEAESSPERHKMAMAMGRSRCVPFLGRSAGAKLTVTFEAGKVKFELEIALRTRSLASLTVLAAMPTMLKEGRPRFLSASILIIAPPKPQGMDE